MIEIISEGVYDTAHSVFEAHEILKRKPDAVFFELPERPFQPILNKYAKGDLTVHQLKSSMFKAMKKEEKHVDHKLVDKFLEGEIEHEELEVIETEGREIHVMQACKKVGARMFAVDLPLDKVDQILNAEFKAEHIRNYKQVIDNKSLPYVVWELNDILHYPFYIMEKILGHHAIKTLNPYIHNVNKCGICKMGAAWDRHLGSLMLHVLNLVPFSRGMKSNLKVSYIINRLDKEREEHMAHTIAKNYEALKKVLNREPVVFVIVHLWNAKQLERMLKGLE